MDVTYLISQSSLIFGCIISLLFLTMVKWMLGWCFLSRRDASLPCLPIVPILGSLLHLRSSLPPHLLFTKLAWSYGHLFSLYMGPHYTLVVSEVALAREVLLHKGREFAGRPKMVSSNLSAFNDTSH